MIYLRRFMSHAEYEGAKSGFTYPNVSVDDEHIHYLKEAIIVIPNDEIWYTSVGDVIVVPNDASGFDANILSNTYEEGKGIIKFDCDISKVGENAFYACSDLISVMFPDSISELGNNCFKYCGGSLERIYMGNSVTSIGEDAFTYCYGITSINSPAGSNLINMPSSLVSIGETAFYNSFNNGIELKIVLPNTIGSFGPGAFSACDMLTNIVYNGTMAEWNDIIQDEEWKAFNSGSIIHCSDGDITI